MKPASRRSLLDTLQTSNIFKCKCLRGGGKKKCKSTNRAELSSHQFSRLFSLPEQKRCIIGSSGLNAAAESLNNCSIMRQIHLDSSWWRTRSLIGGMQLCETFLCLMIYLQAVWALVGKHCTFLLYILRDNNSYCKIQQLPLGQQSFTVRPLNGKKKSVLPKIKTLPARLYNLILKWKENKDQLPCFLCLAALILYLFPKWCDKSGMREKQKLEAGTWHTHNGFAYNRSSLCVCECVHARQRFMEKNRNTPGEGRVD